jgi:hypothetical protein
VEVTPTYREFREAECRLRLSLWVREELPHTYPLYRRDLQTIDAFTNHYGLPPSSLLRRVLWRLKRGL